MASITSLMGGTSSTSSIYGTRNVISGLASGLDTETLIENSVQGLKLKITSLQKNRQKVEWQQEAYRSIISKLSNFNNKYTSYTSATNLLSPSFFNSAVTTTTNGANASKVSATGKTSSDVQINSVSQLATAARYSVGTMNLKPSNVASEAFSLDQTSGVGKLSGTLSLGFGGKTISLSFSEKDVFKTAQEMADAINGKLAEETIAFSGGTQAKASERIRAVASEDGKSISFETINDTAGNDVWIKSASGNLSSALGIPSSIDSKDMSHKSFTFTESNVYEEQSIISQLSKKGFSIVLDGETKTIYGPESAASIEEYLEGLQAEIDDAFGEGKLIVSDADTTDDKLTLQFTAGEDSKFQVTANAAAEALGMEGGLTSYVNTKQKVSDLLAGGLDDAWRISREEGDLKYKDGVYTDADGNQYKKDDTDGKYYQVDSAGKYVYDFRINGESVAKVTEDTTMEQLMTQINGNENSDVKVSYSEFTGKFTFTAKETGENGKIDFGADGLSAAMFGKKEITTGSRINEIVNYNVRGKEFSVTVGDGTTVSFDFANNDGTIGSIVNKLNAMSDDMTFSFDKKTGKLTATDNQGTVHEVAYNEGVAKDLFDSVSYTAGQNAIFSVTVNGETREMTRSTNTIDIDGMNVTLKGEFEEGEAVTFTTSADADKIVDAIKAMIDDYNAMATEIKNAYSTMPEKNSSGKYYEPLTEEDKDGMSESTIKSYEDKAKAGLLFADRDLSNLYNDMLQAIQDAGLEGIGINLSYADGLTTLTLDESKLRATLAENPDKVTDVFTRSQENGASTDSFLQSLKGTLDYYGKTTGTKGLLVEKAGSPLAPTSLYTNDLYNEMVDIDEEIERWQDKISDQIDYYTKKFTYLEQLIAQMNNQSSMLMGFTGG